SVRAESAVEERFAIEGLDVASIPPDAGSVDEVKRLRQVIRDYFVEVVLVTSAHEHRVASMAMRLAGRGAILRRMKSGERATGWLADRLSARTAPSGWLFTSES